VGCLLSSVNSLLLDFGELGIKIISNINIMENETTASKIRFRTNIWIKITIPKLAKKKVERKLFRLLLGCWNNLLILNLN